jgi:dihydrofolate synthase/folylpolyglutamate synthase
MFAQLPMFQRVGVAAYKKNLDNIRILCHFCGNPQQHFLSIHIAGTNGKGSTSQLLASVLNESGLKTGLYTSPHLKNFTERIKINGAEIPQDFVIQFMHKIAPMLHIISPSFFEMTVAMCFDYFAAQKVDVAVIETGLGGRLDSTNIISPVLSLITNISFDHKDLLGHTLPEIAAEKGGIIKKNTPVVVSKTQIEVMEVFIQKAKIEDSELFFADELFQVKLENGIFWAKKSGEKNDILLKTPLNAAYQVSNVAGVLAALKVLNDKNILFVSEENIQNGFKNVLENTRFKGRWQKISQKPLIIADIGHNEDAWNYLPEQIAAQNFNNLYMLIGAVNDKDISAMLSRMPKNAFYCFCKPAVPRGLDANILASEAQKFDLKGEVFASVSEAYHFAKTKAGENDFIFAGGSTFVVAEIEDL